MAMVADRIHKVCIWEEKVPHIKGTAWCQWAAHLPRTLSIAVRGLYPLAVGMEDNFECSGMGQAGRGTHQRTCTAIYQGSGPAVPAWGNVQLLDHHYC